MTSTQMLGATMASRRNQQTNLRSLRDQEQPLTYLRPEWSPVMRKLTIYGAGAHTFKKNMLTWSADEGANLEPFCAMYTEFQHTMREWGLENDGDELFSAFRQLLTGRALEEWSRISEDVSNEFQIDRAAFEVAVDRVVESIAGLAPRDKVEAYLRVPQNILKPHSVDVHSHASRLLQLFRYHDLLPGNAPMMSDPADEYQKRERKNLLFSSFPRQFQFAFQTNKGKEARDPSITWEEIVEWMAIHRTNSDSLRASKERAQQRRGGGGRGHNTSRSHGGRGFQNSRSHQPYPSYQNQNNSYRPHPSQGGYDRYGRQLSGGFQPRYPSNNRFQGRNNRQSGRGRFQNHQGRGNNQNQQNRPPNYNYNQSFYIDSPGADGSQSRNNAAPPERSYPDWEGGTPHENGRWPSDGQQGQQQQQHFYDQMLQNEHFYIGDQPDGDQYYNENESNEYGY